MVPITSSDLVETKEMIQPSRLWPDNGGENFSINTLFLWTALIEFIRLSMHEILVVFHCSYIVINLLPKFKMCTPCTPVAYKRYTYLRRKDTRTACKFSPLKSIAVYMCKYRKRRS